MSEPCPLGRGEGYAVREDEIGRFKGMGFLREGGNRNPPSLRQLFGDFLAAQKVTRPEGWLGSVARMREPIAGKRRASGPGAAPKNVEKLDFSTESPTYGAGALAPTLDS